MQTVLHSGFCLSVMFSFPFTFCIYSSPESEIVSLLEPPVVSFSHPLFAFPLSNIKADNVLIKVIWFNFPCLIIIFPFSDQIDLSSNFFDSVLCLPNIYWNYIVNFLIFVGIHNQTMCFSFFNVLPFDNYFITSLRISFNYLIIFTLNFFP